MTDAAEAELPKAQLKRLIKAKLAAADVARGGDGTRDFQACHLPAACLSNWGDHMHSAPWRATCFED